jgi:hypothetical protein
MDAAVAGTRSARFRPTRSYTNPRDVTERLTSDHAPSTTQL